MSDVPSGPKSYLPAGISALSPWGSRSTTPVPPQQQQGQSLKPDSAQDGQSQKRGQQSSGAEHNAAAPGAQRGGDHSIRMSLKRHQYTPDVPSAEVRWFHAIDVPKRKPVLTGGQPTFEKLIRTPKKYVPFSKRDSRAIETTFQRWSEEDEREELGKNAELHRKQGAGRKEIEDAGKKLHESKSLVPVNEDYLFDVDVLERELRPAYWEGLVYEVRRGLWFNSDGSVTDENLSSQLEDGFLKVKPWTFPPPPTATSRSKSRSRPTSWKGDGTATSMARSNSKRPATPDSAGEGTAAERTPPKSSPQDRLGDDLEVPPTSEPQLNKTHRLFGSYMNSVVTYQDSTTAWLLTDDFLSRMSSNMYQRFAGGGHFAGMKLIRGYVDPSKKSDKTSTDAKDQSKSVTDTAKSKNSTNEDDSSSSETGDQSPESEKKKRRLEKQMSSFVSGTTDDPQKLEEDALKREEKELQADYKDDDSDDQGRQIEHLLLITHGIGQRLGMRMESINFIHDVNTLRKTFKSVYAASSDLQTLNSETPSTSKNCRMQVLPVVWRNRLDFPKQSLKHNRHELDLGDAASSEDEEYPTLDDITVDGVPAVRNLITDLALDVLLYQSPAYKGHISRIVVEEANRVYHLFKQRNPNFKGRVSLIGHSLGSAIMFDLLCRQRSEGQQQHSSISSRRRAGSEERALAFDFEVEDFYALGSPIGLFQMLKGRTIAARQAKDVPPPPTPDDDDGSLADDPFDPGLTSRAGNDSSSSSAVLSKPKCDRLFNIFHPSDPVSYRIEPLISPAMASLKPQPLPYTKRGIFGAPVGQGLTGMGARVGQSISGMWSNMSSNIASSLLNRSLGITGNDSIGANNPSSGHIPQLTAAQLQHYRMDAANAGAGTGYRVREGDDGQRPPTLIDAELETLYAGFQKQQSPKPGPNGASTEKDDDNTKPDYPPSTTTSSTAPPPSTPLNPSSTTTTTTTNTTNNQIDASTSRRLRREESKVRALNANGRVDYSIQEGAFDISLLASIASHLSYWSDEDVVHFMSSQLLARHRVVEGVGNAGGGGGGMGKEDGEKKSETQKG